MSDRNAQLRTSSSKDRREFVGDIRYLHGIESRSFGFVPCFHSMRLETPSSSISRCAKPRIQISIPFSCAQARGNLSGES